MFFSDLLLVLMIICNFFTFVSLFFELLAIWLRFSGMIQVFFWYFYRLAGLIFTL